MNKKTLIIILCIALGLAAVAGVLIFLLLPKGHDDTEHQYEKTVTLEPSCEADGEILYKCACGESYVEKIAALGHSFGAWSVVSEPTESETGALKRACANDASHEEDFTLPALGTEGEYAYEVVTEPECEVDGVGKYTYEKDGESFSFEVSIESIGHRFGEWASTSSPNKNSTGKLTKTCENDSTHKEHYTLPKISTENGYTREVITTAKCDSAGIERYTYQKDGQTFTYYVNVPKLGHDYGEWLTRVAPTATSEGEIYAICRNDPSHVDTFVLPALSVENGYTYELVTPPTNTTEGLCRYTYSKDSQLFIFNVVIKTTETEFDPR